MPIESFLFGEGSFPKLLPQSLKDGTLEIAADEFITAINFQSRLLGALYTNISDQSDRAQVLENLHQSTSEIALCLKLVLCPIELWL